jgi:gamma-glutamyltranspeptidase/glutathione hydrolase
MPVFASRGVVATSESLAAQAGLFVLARGGNAVDAAVATAATLTVVEPPVNGIGADAFAIVWDGKRLHGLNGSGRAPAAHTLDRFRAQSLTKVPMRGWLSVTVPGAPAAWRDLHARFGRLPFETLFEAAIGYAERGFPVSPLTAESWAVSARAFAASSADPEFRGWFETFTPNGTPPGAGDVFRSPGHAATLRKIAASRADDFYRGETAARIAAFAAQTGGGLTRDDLAAHESTWVDPISVPYRGVEVCEIPPNGQGIAALAALRLLEGFDLAKRPRDDAESFHLQIECMKLAFADAYAFVADPAKVDVPTRGLLDPAYLASRRSLVRDRAASPVAGSPPRGGTVYLCAADADGMMVSFIQSNFHGFGSGIVVPGTGIALQNRGYGFSLDPAHPNVVAPGKRPFHTILPAFLLEEGRAVGPFGVMGGSMQPQGHAQVVANQVDWGMNPQAALDAPRWRWVEGTKVAVEPGVPDAVVRGLRDRGHEVVVEPATAAFGRGQVIRRLANGAFVAGSDFRADGAPAGF